VKIFHLLLAVIWAGATIMAAAAQDSPLNPSAQAATETAKPPIEKNPPPINTKNMDTSVKPQDDFFMYADGGWSVG